MTTVSANASTAALIANSEAIKGELLFRSLIAKIVLDHPGKFETVNPEVITKAKTFDTSKGYVELLLAANKFKTDKPELMKSLNAQLKNGMDIMENVIEPNEARRKSIMKNLDGLGDDIAQDHLDGVFRKKHFTAEEVTAINQALTPEVPVQA